MDNFLIKLIEKTTALLIIGGFVLIVVALVKINPNGIEVIEAINRPNLILLIIGTMLLALGLVFYCIEGFSFPFRAKNFQFKKVSADKYSIKVNSSCILNIIYGTISNFQDYDSETLVILPANDKFDDKCVDDKKSVLGSFANDLYPDGNENFKDKIKIEVAKEKKGLFEIGEWIYLNKLGKTEFNAGMIAVTHLNEDGSITTNPENVILAFNGVFKMIKQKRPNKIFIPLIGSGHGELSPRLSFLFLLISIIENMKKVNGNNMREVNIVVYKKGNHRTIELKAMEKEVKFILNLL
jgi:hypothetical protein